LRRAGFSARISSRRVGFSLRVFTRFKRAKRARKK
jgi:hypothetical protein